MDLMEARRHILMGQPHQVTVSGSMVHFVTDMAAPLIITGSGTLSVCGFNIYNQAASGILPNSYLDSTGAVGSSNNWHITDYMPVYGAGSIRYWRIGDSGTIPYCAWYDAGKNLIGTFKHYDSTASTRPAGYVQTVPDSAVFCRMSLRNTVKGDAVVIIGDGEISAYEAYSGASGSGIKTRKGVNNAWSDSGGNITVKYWTH